MILAQTPLTNLTPDPATGKIAIAFPGPVDFARVRGHIVMPTGGGSAYGVQDTGSVFKGAGSPDGMTCAAFFAPPSPLPPDGQYVAVVYLVA